MTLFTGVIFFICSTAGLSSCSNSSGISSQFSSPGVSATSDPDSNSADSKDTAAPIVSGTLRLWMQTPKTLNPLVSTQYQWKEISHLFYESLYEINSKQEAIPALAEDCTLSDDGLTYTIHLKKSILFSNNTAFDSADVLATAQFIQNPASQSIYVDQLKNVTAINAVDSGTIQFVLAAMDPFFLYELDFPILPSESVSNPAVVAQPGTGQYQIASYEKGKQLNAALFLQNRNAKDCKIKSITVLELTDTRAAMQAFGEDRVDVVLLHDSSYETYYLRNDVKIIRYPSSQYLFFEMNQSAGKALLDEAKADYIRSLLQNPLLFDGIKSIFCTANAMPFLSTCPLIHLNQCKDILTITKGDNPFIKETKKLEIIYPLGDTVKEKLMVQLKKILDLEKIPYNAAGYDPAAYGTALQSGSYDLAVREAQLTDNPDPSWLYLNTTLRSIKGIESLNRNGTGQYIQGQTALQQKLLTPKITIIADEFCGVLNQVNRYGPYIGVGFRINGVIQSKRIRGQLDPNSFNQYNNIEEVWVWSGQ